MPGTASRLVTKYFSARRLLHLSQNDSDSEKVKISPCSLLPRTSPGSCPQ